MPDDMSKRSILVVEDDPLSMKLTRKILELEGYRVIEATDGVSGVETAQQARPDLIILDVGLSGIDGLTAARMLKQDSRTSHIPVLAVTAFAMRGDKERVLEAGYDAYMTKPINAKALISRVRQFLS